MLSILAFAAIVIFTVYAFKSARDYGRNGILWAFLTFGTGFALQFVIPFFVGILLAIILMVQGVPPNRMQDSVGGWGTLIGILGIVLSFIGMGVVLKLASRIPEGGEMPPSRKNSNLGLDL